MTEITKIHGGTLEFSEPRHQYFWNDSKVANTVSAICGEGYPLAFSLPSAWAAKVIREDLIAAFKQHNNALNFADAKAAEAWAKDLCKAHIRARDTAAEAGTAIHDFIERHAQGLEPDLPADEPARRSAAALRDWFSHNVEMPLSMERLVYHPEHAYAGKLDMFARLRGGGDYVLDWKGVTSLKYPPKPGHVGQGAAYCAALAAEGIEVAGFVLVEIERDSGVLRATKYTDMETEFEMFLAALRLVRHTPHGVAI